MPIPITDNWKMITRPVITWAAAPVPNSIDASGEANFDTEYGLVNAQLPFLFSPKSQSAFAWGLGPTFQTPNNTNSKLDDDNWEAGIGNVLIYKPTNWTIGMETQYWWSFEEDGDDEETEHAQFNIFIWHDLGGGRQVGYAPTITYDAKADSGNAWNVPVGGAFAFMTTMFGTPTKIQMGLEKSIVRQDDFGADWTFFVNIIPVIPVEMKPLFSN